MLERTNFLSKQKKIVYLPENKLFLRLVWKKLIFHACAKKLKHLILDVF